MTFNLEDRKFINNNQLFELTLAVHLHTTKSFVDIQPESSATGTGHPVLASSIFDIHCQALINDVRSLYRDRSQIINLS